MPVILNGQLLDQLPTVLQQTQRALYYADGLFESIRMFEGNLPFFRRHWERLTAGLQAWRFALPATWTSAFFEQEIKQIARGNARVRLQVWRSPGGLYLPEDHTPQYLITTTNIESGRFDWPEQGIALCLCTSVRLAADSFSPYKTLNTARYVVAKQEAAALGYDEALLLNALERVCEASSSNVFWWEGNTLCTVPLSEACVAGVMRAFLLEIARAGGYAIQEKAITFTQLQAADEIFLTNAVRGIIPVRIFADKSFASTRTQQLFKLLGQAVKI